MMGKIYFAQAETLTDEQVIKNVISHHHQQNKNDKEENNEIIINRFHDNGHRNLEDIIEVQEIDIEKNIENLIAEAYEAFNNNYLEVALQLYEKLLQHMQDDVDIKFAIAIIHQKLGHINEAKEFYLEVLEDDPGNIMVMLNYINLLSFEDPEQAIDILNDLSKVEPKLAAIAEHKALIYSRYRFFEHAIVEYKKAFKLDSNRLDYLYNMGLLFEKIAQPYDALIAYRYVVKQNRIGHNHVYNIDIDRVQRRISRIINYKM